MNELLNGVTVTTSSKDFIIYRGLIFNKNKKNYRGLIVYGVKSLFNYGYKKTTVFNYSFLFPN